MKTRNTAVVNADIKARVDVNEQAKKEKLLWFASFKEIPKLDDRIANFSTWQMAIKSACEKQNCLNLLKSEPHLNDKLGMNNCKNVNMLIAHSIDEDTKMDVLKKSMRLVPSHLQCTTYTQRTNGPDIGQGVKNRQYIYCRQYSPTRAAHEA